MTVLLGACAASAPSPTYPQYVVGRSGDGQAVGWIDVAPCSQAPKSWSDVAVYCDLSKATVVDVGPEVVRTYDGGDPYPKPAITLAPSPLTP